MLPMHGDGTTPNPLTSHNETLTGAALLSGQPMQGRGIAQVSKAKRPDQFFTSDPVFFVSSFCLLSSFVLFQVARFLA